MINLKLTIMYQLQLVWNREFNYCNYSNSSTNLKELIKKGESLLNSGDGARVKKFRIINEENEVVYPISKTFKPHQYYPKLYTCNFCDKQKMGKPYSYLINPSGHSNITKHVLCPKGWKWIFVNPCKNNDVSYSCGCHTFK